MNDELKRLKELKDYNIWNASEKNELSILANFAASLFNTPASLVTVIEGDRLWFEANEGSPFNEIPFENSFCSYAVQNPDQVFEVKDASEDERFSDNSYVKGFPFLKYYMGVPLVTPRGNVLGTLCVIDNKPRKMTKGQKKSLQILATKAIEYLEMRKEMLNNRVEIANSAEKLIKLTSNIPLTVFQLRKLVSGDFKYDFLSLGEFWVTKNLNIQELKNNPWSSIDVIDAAYIDGFNETINKSAITMEPWDFTFKLTEVYDSRWFKVKAMPEKQENGDVVWYGFSEDVSHHVNYEEAMERMAFDISHVLRKPVANLMTLSDMITQEKDIDEEQLKEYAQCIKDISHELNKFTHELDLVYRKKWDLAAKFNKISTVKIGE